MTGERDAFARLASMSTHPIKPKEDDLMKQLLAHYYKHQQRLAEFTQEPFVIPDTLPTNDELIEYAIKRMDAQQSAMNNYVDKIIDLELEIERLNK